MTYLVRPNMYSGRQSRYYNLVNGYYEFTTGCETYTTYYSWGITAGGGSISPTELAIDGNVYYISNFQDYSVNGAAPYSFSFGIYGSTAVTSATRISYITRTTSGYGTSTVSTSSPTLYDFNSSFDGFFWQTYWIWERHDYIYPMGLNFVPVGTSSQIEIAFPTS